MGKVAVLSEFVANKIAAGEVVERPASIVKELIENSLDAKATRIEIEIQHGGKSLIRVADNGLGMGAEDAQMSLRRHATSKIREVEDLDSIGSFGFRGEALPSIAAVSRFTLQTRSRENDIGTEVSIDGGHLSGAKECSLAVGTIVEARDLFFNTPARRKFLKQDTTEYGHILDVVVGLALANAEIYFSLKSNGKEVLTAAPTADLKARAAMVLGDDWANETIPVNAEIPNVKITGLIGNAAIASANRSGQYFFVNKRWVKAYGLSYGLQAGFHGVLMSHQQPAAILFLTLDSKAVDVNVHPTKQQVRISNEASIKTLLEKTVADALRKNAGAKMPFEELKKTFSSETEDFLPPPSQSAFAQTESASTPDAFKLKEETTPSFVSIAENDSEILIGKDLRVKKILGQVQRTYILIETQSGCAILDQHAAHERVMFEVLMKSFETGGVSVQRLLMEEAFELHPRQLETMQKQIPFLNKLGFDVEPFGDNSFVVRALPSILEGSSPAAIIKEYIEEKETGKQETRLQGASEDIAALTACKRKSIKANDVMSIPAMQSLLEQLAKCENPFNCPHGRPTLIRYSLRDLEKQFKRKI